MITIVMMEPEKPGNIGAVARIMKNFGFKELVLISPRCEVDEDSRKRAKHAQDVIRNIRIKDKKFLKGFDYVIATTGKLGTDYNLPRTPIIPSELAEKLLRIKNSNMAILLGNEGKGLSNKEIKDADIVVTIPANKHYPVLNISHALAIILYELYDKEKIKEKFKPISKKEKEQIMKMLNKALNKMEFSTKGKKETQRMVWKRMINKAFLTRREAYALMGFLKKII